MSQDDLPEGERIELGPDDILQESAQEWILGAGAAAGAGKVAVDFMRVKLDRDRLEFEQRQYEDQQRANDPGDPGEAA